MSALFVLQEPQRWNYFFVVAGHPFKAWISAVVQNKDGEGEGHGRCDERIGRQSLVEGERKREREFCQSGVAKQVWLRASLGTVPTRRQCVASVDCSTDAHKSQRACDCGARCVCLERRLVHICMCSGGVVAQQEGGGGGWAPGLSSSNQRCYQV